MKSLTEFNEKLEVLNRELRKIISRSSSTAKISEKSDEGGARLQKRGAECWAPLSWQNDDEIVVRALFNEIDSDCDGIISLNEMKSAVVQYKMDGLALKKALADAMEDLIVASSQDKQIDFDRFLEIVKDLPRVRGERVQFAKGLELHSYLAPLLKTGNFFDGLQGLRELSEDQITAHLAEVSAVFSRILTNVLASAILGLKQSTPSALETNSKFSMDTDSFEGSFAEIDDFYQGPEKLVGAPNPRVEEGIRREHCERSNATTPFTTPNYNVTTCARTEYEFVIDPRDGYAYAHTPIDKALWSDVGRKVWKGERGREPLRLCEFESHLIAQRSALRKGEVIALRLYTGPMYMLYNAVLRKYPVPVFDALKGNTYETTIFCIVSGIVKLSKTTAVPKDRRLFRGLGGMLLPPAFWKKNAFGFRGGVEWGLMSTTTDRSVAMQYSGANQQRGTIFQIDPGRIDIGADLAWVSQYPGEREFLFPPLSCLEVMEEPRVEDEVIVVPLRVNICLRGLTLEQLVERRKELHLAMIKTLSEELSIEAPTVMFGSAEQVGPRHPSMHIWRPASRPS